MKVVATSLLLILTWAAQESQCGVLPQEPEGENEGLPANKSRDYMAAVVAANEQFSQKLLSSHAQLGPQENLIFSPSSLSTVLTMLATGARGKALRQLQQGLSLPMQGKNVFLCMMIELHRV